MKTKSERRFQIIANAVMIIITLLCVFPFILLIIASFTAENEIVLHGYSLFPKEWSLSAYKYIWEAKGQIFRAYGMTILVTAAGTSVSIVITCLYAYALSRRDLPGNMIFAFFLFFTMLFNGGLVPSYLMWTETFHIKNSIGAFIFPGLLMSAFNVILVRTYFQANVPTALLESARIDGAGEYKILLRVVVPLAKPIIATIALFVGVAYWNDWTNGLYYVTEPSLFTIQNLLNNMMKNIEYLTNNAGAIGNLGSEMAKIPKTTVRMAIAVIGILPIMVIYPFIQKNFVKGIAVGAVKG